MKINGSIRYYSNKQQFDFSIIFLFLFYVFLLRGVSSENHYTFIMLLGWLFTAFLTSINSFKSIFNNKVIIILLFYLGYTLAISLVVEGLTTSIGYLLSQLTLFSGVFMFIYYKHKYSQKRFKKLLFVLIFIWIYYCWKAISFYNVHEFAARNIISHNAEQYGTIAIGKGYGLALGASLLGVYLMNFLFIKSQAKWEKPLIIFVIITSIILVYKTGSTITLIALLVGILLNIFQVLDKRLDRQMYLKISIRMFLLTFLFILLASVKKIGNFLIEISGNFNQLYESRLLLIGEKLVGESSSGTLAVREFFYNKSIETFLDYPIFGTVHINGLVRNPLIGGHSELLDSLALLGIIGGVLYISIFIMNIIYERLASHKYLSSAYIFTFLILFLFNQFNYPQANFFLFFIIPGLSDLFKYKYKRGKKIFPEKLDYNK